MSGQAIDLTAANFAANTAKGMVLIDFWAPWCGPCKMMGPILDNVATQVAGKAVVAKVNIDDEPALARQFRVMSIPTLVLLKDGALVKQWIGIQQAAGIVDVITKA